MRIIHRIHSPYEYYVNNKNPKLFKVRGVDRSPLRCTTGAQNEEQSHDDHHGGERVATAPGYDAGDEPVTAENQGRAS